MKEPEMATSDPAADAMLEAQIANTVAGHRMAGFDVTEADREMLRAFDRGETTIEQIIQEIKAANAAKNR